MPRARGRDGDDRRAGVARGRGGRVQITALPRHPRRTRFGQRQIGRRAAARNHGRRLGHRTHRLVAWFGGAVAIAILAVGFAFWRLLEGPIALDRLTPYVAAALNRTSGNLSIAVSGVRLGLDRDSRRLELTLAGVHVLLPNGEPLAAFPEMEASFRPAALLRGRIEPARLVVARPILRLVRGKDGGLEFGFGGTGGSSNPRLALDALERLAEVPQMPQIAIRDATLVLDDRRAGGRWQATRVDAEVKRAEGGLAGDLSLALLLGTATPELHLRYRYAAAARTLDIEAQVGDVEPAALAPLSPELAPLAALRFPVSGSLATRLDLTAAASEGLRVDLAFEKGMLDTAQLADGPVAIERGELHAAYIPAERRLRLAKLGLDLGGGAALTVAGRLDGVGPSLLPDRPVSQSGQLDVVLSKLPVAKLAALWPRSLSPGGRRWVVANIGEGLLDEASFRLGLAPDPQTAVLDVVSAGGEMRFRDLAIRYFDGLPPVRNVSGTARLAGNQLDFFPKSGNAGGIAVSGGTLRISDLGGPVEWLAIDLDLKGPIRDALSLLDRPPLGYMRRIGLDPGRIGGRTDTRLHFKLPLLAALKLDQVEYRATAELRGASIAKLAFGRDLEDGDFALDLDHAGVRLQGRARLAGIPAKLDARLLFAAGSGPRQRFGLAAVLDEDARRRLGLDLLSGRLAGPVGVNLTYSAFDDGRAEADARLDLQQATLDVAEANWRKPAGRPGHARLVVDLDHDRVARLPLIEVTADGLDGRFSAMFDGDSRAIQRIAVDRLVLGPDDVRGSVSRRKEGGWQIELRGRRLDLSDTIGKLARDPSPDLGNAPPLAIDARLDRLILGPGHELRDVSGAILREGAYWQAAQLGARFANGRRLALRFGPLPQNRQLSFHAGDLGRTLAILGLTDNVKGGNVTVVGSLSDRDGKRILRGHFTGEDYSFVHAPALARALSVTSLTAFAKLLEGGGIPFTRLDGDFSYSEGRLDLDHLLAYGGALGATASGSYDLRSDSADLSGTIVPAYTLNTVLGNLPVIGPLLLGGEGQGLIAATYRLTGPDRAPQLLINPLSVLTPGLLRRLFEPNFGMPLPEGDPEKK